MFRHPGHPSPVAVHAGSPPQARLPHCPCSPSFAGGKFARPATAALLPVILFPELFDRMGGAVCGFVVGLLVLAVVVLSYCMMPISRKDVAGGFLPVKSLDQFSTSTVARVCNFSAFLSLECLDGAAEKTAEELIALSHPKKQEPQAAPAMESASPVEPAPDESQVPAAVDSMM